MMEYDEDHEDAQCEHGNYYNQVECEDCMSANEIPDSGEEE